MNTYILGMLYNEILYANIHTWFKSVHILWSFVIPPSDRTATVRRPYGDQKMYKVAGKREQNARKSLKKYKLKQICVLTAFLLRPVRSYHVLTACTPRPLRVYGGVVLASSGYLLTWWWTRNTVMKTTWSWWGRHEIGVVLRTPWNCLCKCNHFRGVFATRVLRVYYVYRDVTTLGSRPSRPHRVLTTFQVRSPNLGVCFEHVQNKRRDSAIIGDHWRPWRPQHDVWRFYHVSTTFTPRLWRPCRALDPFSVAVDAQ